MARSKVKTRNIGLRVFRVGDVLDNPGNFRTHDQFQRDSFAAVVDQVGFFGYPDVFIRADGRPMLIDGELRKHDLIARYGADAEIEFNVTDFDAGEADVALATKDHLGALAGVEAKRLGSLLDSLQVESNERLDKLLTSLRDQAGAAQVPPAAPETDPDVLGGSQKTLSATLTDAQHAIVQEAIKEAKRRGRLATTAAALALMAKEWLAAYKPHKRKRR